MSDFNLDADEIFGEKKQNNTTKESDIPLRWISNGNDCTKRGTVYIDTEFTITPETMVFIKFNAAKWDGPVAGYSYYRSNMWELSMLNNRLIFNYPIQQAKQLNVGIFLPNKDYCIVAANPIAIPVKNDNKVNWFEGIKYFFLCLKARSCSYFSAGESAMEPLCLFRSGDRNYSWQGLKIMSLMIYDSGRAIVADMKPVLHNSTPCFYDSVRNRYFYFSGKGDVFIEKY